MVTIISKEWTGSSWLVLATVTSPGATLAGPHILNAPELATDDDLKAAILALYSPNADDAPASPI